jgi:DNA-binding CsgD family transcriptional regulator
LQAALHAAERFPVVLAVALATMAGATIASAHGDLNGVLAAIEPVRATRLLGVGGCPAIFNWRPIEADALIRLGGLDDADAEFERAQLPAASVQMPFETALVNLDDGRRLRADGNRPAAVTRLESAHRVFSNLGADPYVQSCATELAALEVPAAGLVATGLTNREVASQLYLSVKTVEYHLRNSYMKLEITSRRELAALLH